MDLLFDMILYFVLIWSCFFCEWQFNSKRYFFVNPPSNWVLLFLRIHRFFYVIFMIIEDYLVFAVVFYVSDSRNFLRNSLETWLSVSLKSSFQIKKRQNVFQTISDQKTFQFQLFYRLIDHWKLGKIDFYV